MRSPALRGNIPQGFHTYGTSFLLRTNVPLSGTLGLFLCIGKRGTRNVPLWIHGADLCEIIKLLPCLVIPFLIVVLICGLPLNAQTESLIPLQLRGWGGYPYKVGAPRVACCFNLVGANTQISWEILAQCNVTFNSLKPKRLTKPFLFVDGSYYQ